jgi:hypothetical protein
VPNIAQERLSLGYYVPSKQENDQEYSPFDLHGISRRTQPENLTGPSFGREWSELQTVQPEMGNPRGKLDGQESPWTWQRRRKTSHGKTYEQRERLSQMGFANWTVQPKKSSQNSKHEPIPNAQHCPFPVGTILWVKETWKPHVETSVHSPAIYQAEYELSRGSGPWKSARFMPKWATRLWLEVTEVRAQRVREITEEDAKAEGCPGDCCFNDVPTEKCSDWFRLLWDSLNAKRGFGWDVNPSVFCYSFRRIERET